MGRKEARAGGREDTEEWVWEERCRERPAEARRERSGGREWGGEEGGHRTTRSPVLTQLEAWVDQERRGLMSYSKF